MKYLVVYALCWTIGAALMAHAATSNVSAASKNIRYVVQAGDTIWNIALTQQSSEDPQGAVVLIESMNHLKGDDTVHPGQVLWLPHD